jgi:hypothetical protein
LGWSGWADRVRPRRKVCVGESGTGAWRTVEDADEVDVDLDEDETEVAKVGTARLDENADDVVVVGVSTAGDASWAARGRRGASAARDGATRRSSSGAGGRRPASGGDEVGSRSSDDGGRLAPAACRRAVGRTGEDDVGVA